MTAMERRAARQPKGGAGVDMNLVSLIDVFTILIFFLLVQMGPAEILASPRAVQLPASTAEKMPRQTLVLVVTGEEIKKVMVTCAAANFGDVSFGLRRKEGKAEA